MTTLYFSGTFVDGEVWLMARHYQQVHGGYVEIAVEAVCRMSVPL